MHVERGRADEVRRSGVYRVVTPDECVALAQEFGRVLLHPLMGGMPPDAGLGEPGAVRAEGAAPTARRLSESTRSEIGPRPAAAVTTAHEVDTMATRRLERERPGLLTRLAAEAYIGALVVGGMTVVAGALGLLAAMAMQVNSWVMAVD